ncbi:BatD family protein [Kiritimatiella glycovorans]|uniref:Protein BatD n=1 Tax=Kiritimatiella glycovorans TaxID=1307763 RepID=A0A0G3EHF3_9BACT|nr:BatD family protein [Kiritimatiella glycovorans]AKJ64270.1 hypothetical protein L21SP4_01011 [Kiritimatiella glycovorans]
MCGIHKNGAVAGDLLRAVCGALLAGAVAVGAEDGSDASPQAAPAARPAKEMDLQVDVSETEAVVDQPIIVTVTWTSRVPFKRCRRLLLDLPLLRGASLGVRAMEPGVPEARRIGLPVNGRRVIARRETIEGRGERIAFSFRIIPREPGGLPSEPVAMRCALIEGPAHEGRYPSYFDNHFFNGPESDESFERIYLSSPVPEVRVAALPSRGRTERYTGVAETVSARATVDPEDVRVGEPMLLTVEIAGTGYGPDLARIPEPVLGDTGPGFRVNPRPIREQSDGSRRSFTYVMRPVRAGLETVPALALQFFDPVAEEYKMVRTAPLTVTVRADGERRIYQPDRSGEAATVRAAEGIRGNRNGGGRHMDIYEALGALARYGWLCIPLPPLLWLVLRPAVRRRERCRRDPAYARALRAARRFRRRARSDEKAAWRTYLGERLNLAPEAVTFGNVSRELRRRGVDPTLIEAVGARFEQEDAERYAPRRMDVRRTPPRRELVGRIERATRAALLLILMLACHAGAAPGATPSPELIFDRAMELRTEEPDRARPLFEHAALVFEARGHYLNAGNSWFFAGRDGRALAAYRLAERRRPFDARIRESLAVIRARREDRFPEPESPGSGLAALWSRFSRWSPLLRGGALIAVYLLGWGVFIAARFAGRRVPRAACIAGGLVAATLLLSLLTSALQPPRGVLIRTAEARLGPGYAYDAAYESPLHEAVEFDWLGRRKRWVRARFPDGREAWLPASACLSITESVP